MARSKIKSQKFQLRLSKIATNVNMNNRRSKLPHIKELLDLPVEVSADESTSTENKESEQEV